MTYLEELKKALEIEKEGLGNLEEESYRLKHEGRKAKRVIKGIKKKIWEEEKRLCAENIPLGTDVIA